MLKGRKGLWAEIPLKTSVSPVEKYCLNSKTPAVVGRMASAMRGLATRSARVNRLAAAISQCLLSDFKSSILKHFICYNIMLAIRDRPNYRPPRQISSGWNERVNHACINHNKAKKRQTCRAAVLRECGADADQNRYRYNYFTPARVLARTRHRFRCINL